MSARTVRGIAEEVRRGRLDPVDAVTQALAGLEAAAALGAVTHLGGAAALEAAQELRRRRERGLPLGPLAGVPIAVKDALCTTCLPTTAGTKILTRDGAAASGWRSPYDATVITRLREAGAVIVAKTAQDELSMGSTSETCAFGPVRNPWDRSRSPGGSSGGSAAVVALRAVPAALGSDTGGSVRQPAALTGVVGVKPSYGRVSRWGLVAFASSLDCVGPLAADVRDAALLLEHIAGADEHDATALDAPVGRYVDACERGVRGLRVGVPEEYFGAGLAPEVDAAVRRALDGLVSLGATLIPISLPHTSLGVATYYVLATAEASSNLSRFDGVRFGSRVEPPRATLSTLYTRTRSEGFGEEVKRRILLGTYVLSAGHYEAYYDRALRVRSLVARDFDRAFQAVDVIATPTSPSVAPPLGWAQHSPLTRYLSDAFTLPASLAGLPALSVPCQRVAPSADTPALPCGLQLIGPRLGEATLFAAAAAWEALNPDAESRPPA